VAKDIRVFFRPEAVRNTGTRLTGDVVIAIPISWQLIGYAIAVMVILAMVFISTATYFRTESVPGVIAPNTGIVDVVAPRAGTVTEVRVHQRQHIEAGDIVATVSVEELSATGESVAEKLNEAIQRQSENIRQQIETVALAAAAQRHQVTAERSGVEAEISRLEEQVQIQGRLITSSEEDFKSATTLQEKGFISPRDLKQREDALLTRRQQLSQLEQTLSSRRANVRALEQNSSSISAQGRSQTFNLQSIRAQIDQQAVNAKQAKAYVLRSPISGRVSTISAKLGQHVSGNANLMSILPAHARLRAELYVPTSAIGFVRVGQEVRLAIDAFPYQRFGTIKGKISAIASSAISERAAGQQAIRSHYPVYVDLLAEEIDAYGRKEPLVPDMSLVARIVTARQSFLEWMFEPIFAVANRSGQ